VVIQGPIVGHQLPTLSRQQYALQSRWCRDHGLLCTNEPYSRPPQIGHLLIEKNIKHLPYTPPSELKTFIIQTKTFNLLNVPENIHHPSLLATIYFTYTPHNCLLSICRNLSSAIRRHVVQVYSVPVPLNAWFALKHRSLSHLEFHFPSILKLTSALLGNGKSYGYECLVQPVIKG